jgi:DNA ligase-associated metallophosphoesterase
MTEIILQGEKIVLLPERGLWWAAQRTLIVSDLHWGKSAHFRKHGIAIPSSTQPKDEIRLAGLIRKYQAERLIIAGDLFHSQDNLQVEGFSHFRAMHTELNIDLVVGNHDILPLKRYTDWDLEVHKEKFLIGPFCITHDMVAECEQFIIHGHVHPAIRITGRGHQALKLCCFCEDEDRMILPAFGAFTGNHMIQAADYKHVYVIGEEKVIQWK